ncbi:MAG: OmpA family protein, partial [Cyclobacteriaceae bacterium]
RQRRDQRYGEGFTDQFIFKAGDEENILLQKLSDALNTRSNDGSGTYSEVNRTYYFTVCGYKVSHCQLYSSEWNGEEFTEPLPLPDLINYPGKETMQPGISATGDTLYFVSNRPGGQGMNDIWMSVRSGSGWGPPVNLGSTINTSLNENTPYPVMGNMLIFSSDGHQGFGGMDLYLARRLTGGDTVLANFGIPFNTSRDDMFPNIKDSSIYWSSNRAGGLGGFDIYTSDIHSPLYLTSMVSALSRDASRKSALGESRELPDAGASIAAIVNTGEVEFSNLSQDTQEQIDRIALGKTASTPSDLSVAQVELFVAQRKKELGELDKREISIDFNDNEAEGHYQVTGSVDCYQCDTPPTLFLTDGMGNRLQLTIPDANGKFRFSHLKAGENLRIEIDSSFTGITTIHNIGVNFIPDYRKFNLMPVYFNLAESEVRTESYTVLQWIAQFLNENQGYQLEIIAHADKTGSEEYNMLLTRQRGQAVFDALLRSGVSPVSMMIRARGSSEPAADNSTPLGRQLNRRVEFIVSGKGNMPDGSMEFCFTKRAMSGSELMGHLTPNLIRVNGIMEDENYRSYLPVLTAGELSQDVNDFHCPNRRDK